MADKIKHAGNLAGYSVLVTGGGTGIGTGCAAELAADGAAVTFVAGAGKYWRLPLKKLPTRPVSVVRSGW